ncbi:MAG: hypothetical protein E7418_00135 [Ruminococcaceae bacterium]|nr:hypothetical protein [Oscillospiraceae bacterium]
MKKLLALILSIILIVGLCPMQAAVVSAAEDENVALGLVPTCKEDREGNIITNLTDGNPLSIWSGPAGIDQNWVMLDLGVPHVISQVILHVRVDVNADYYREAANLELSNTPDFAQKVVYEAFPSIDPETGEPYEITIKDKKAYRYVRVIKTNSVTLTFNEFEVYGSVPTNELKIGDDIVGTSIEGPATLLAHLGLMGMKDPDNTLFVKDAIFTRAEAVAAVVDAFAGNVSFSGGIPFNDVDKAHPYYMDVMTACHLGYITGDNNTTFRPDDYVTTTEFLFITLRAMGYDDVIEKLFGNDPGRVINLTEKLKLLKGVTVESYNAPVTRGQAAVIFYNALLAPEFNMFAAQEGFLTFSDEADMLRRNHGLVLIQGIVEENRITNLEGDAKANKNSAKISGRKFVDPEGKLDNFLGKEVIIATDVDGSGEIVLAWSTQKEQEIVIPASALCSDVADIEAGRIVAYDEDGDEESYVLESPVRVIKNELSYPYFAPEDLLITNGQLRLLDNDRDGVYEVVFLEEYSLHYIESAFYDDNTFTFVDSEGVRKVLDRENLVVAASDGNSIGLRRVASGTVIKLFASNDGSFNRIVLYDTPVIGKLTAYSMTEASVDGVRYGLSLSYQNTILENEPVPGEPVSAFVDEAGDILWIERDTKAINDGWVIAFSQQTAVGSGLSPKLGFRMFTQDAKWVEAYVGDKVVVDGVSTTKDNLTKMIADDSENRFTGALLRYKLNTAGHLAQIDTQVETAAEAKLGASFGKGLLVMEGMYTSGSAGFWNGHTMVTPAKSDTPTFVIPTVNSEFTTDSSYDSLYYVRNLSSMLTSHQQRSDYNLQSYMPDEDGYPACFMKTQNYSASVGESTESMVGINSTNAPFMLVEKAVYSTTPDGEVGFKLTGRVITSSGLGAESSIIANAESSMIESGLLYQEQPDCLNESNLVIESAIGSLTPTQIDRYVNSVTDIGFGDIIRYEAGSSTVRTVERYFDYDEKEPAGAGDNPKGAVWHISGNNISHYSGYYRFQIGEIMDVSDNAITVKTVFGNEEIYPKNAFANVVVCEKSGTKYKIGSVTNLGQYEGANVQIMLYSYNGAPRAACIYPYYE